jgi:hypothetical protein
VVGFAVEPVTATPPVELAEGRDRMAEKREESVRQFLEDEALELV